jgi:hypothetical protein
MTTMMRCIRGNTLEFRQALAASLLLGQAFFWANQTMGGLNKKASLMDSSGQALI